MTILVQVTEPTEWPELGRLICHDNPECSYSCNKALLENLAIVDWFFYHRIQKFIEAFNFSTFLHTVCIDYTFVQFMQFPVFVFRLVHFTSKPFINNTFTVVM